MKLPLHCTSLQAATATVTCATTGATATGTCGTTATTVDFGCSKSCMCLLEIFVLLPLPLDALTAPTAPQCHCYHSSHCITAALLPLLSLASRTAPLPLCFHCYHFSHCMPPYLHCSCSHYSHCYY